jgi:hypothetical protein
MEELIERPEPEGNDDRLVDEAMLEMGEFLSQMTDVEGYMFDAEMSAALRVEKVEMSMPIQLDIQVTASGSVILGGSPPLFYTETTFSPVFHQLTINIIAEHKEKQERDGGHK